MGGHLLNLFNFKTHNLCYSPAGQATLQWLIRLTENNADSGFKKTNALGDRKTGIHPTCISLGADRWPGQYTGGVCSTRFNLKLLPEKVM